MCPAFKSLSVLTTQLTMQILQMSMELLLRKGTKKVGILGGSLNDGDLNGAIANAKEDLGWSSSTQMST
jgi:hypothetical protein